MRRDGIVLAFNYAPDYERRSACMTFGDSTKSHADLAADHLLDAAVGDEPDHRDGAALGVDGQGTGGDAGGCCAVSAVLASAWAGGAMTTSG